MSQWSPGRGLAVHVVVGVRYRGVGGVRYTGLVGRGSTQPVQYGIARAQPLVLTGVSASTQALQALLGPSAHLGSSHSAAAALLDIGRDSAVYILKLVNNPECHLKYVMRPAILPISKTGPKVTTLNSRDFHIG